MGRDNLNVTWRRGCPVAGLNVTVISKSRLTATSPPVFIYRESGSYKLEGISEQQGYKWPYLGSCGVGFGVCRGVARQAHR